MRNKELNSRARVSSYVKRTKYVGYLLMLDSLVETEELKSLSFSVVLHSRPKNTMDISKIKSWGRNRGERALRKAACNTNRIIILRAKDDVLYIHIRKGLGAYLYYIYTLKR